MAGARQHAVFAVALVLYTLIVAGWAYYVIAVLIAAYVRHDGQLLRPLGRPP